MEEKEAALYCIGMTDYQMEAISSAGWGNEAMVGPTSGNWNYSEASLLFKCFYLAKHLYMGTEMIDSHINPILSLS